MELRSLLAHVPEYTLLQGDPALDVAGIAYDSREVRPGDLFVCWRGLRFDGHAFVAEALSRGAVAVVAERPVEGALVQVVVPDGREALARLSAAFYGFPSRRMRLVGVTGTNGKTTTTHLIKAVLEEAGCKVGLIGTIRHLVGDEVLESHRTTPESLDLQRLLFHMAERGMDYAVMEVSSHAMALKRTVGVEYDVAVFTNVTRDHLDFHASFEEYAAVKAQLFASLDPAGAKPRKAAVVNMDDPHANLMSDASRVPVIGYGIGQSTDVYAADVIVRPSGVSYRARTPAGELPLQLQLTGRFNVYNSLAALAVGWHEGVPLATIRTALERVPGVPGRLERVDRGQDFTVLVDYAHTPDSLENVLETCRGFAPGRVLVVFGCGGDRDRGKRPAMGSIAARLADVVIITSDNPRSEDPAAICREVEAGVLAAGPPPGGYHVVVERRDAIREAIRLAQPGDIVLIAGKGHETYQIFRDRTVHFDDREEAAHALKERFGDGAASG
ncbi:MAG: UDP-N-acetylmuramoyl-L-alanyl-D-glutamate--2,6-diaminopimelate ligase [Firmicutes bacterium ZCTH02-B6]|nr:MAG: UDP-N-acetylmuramoyl-L-alanyl-D-glutamate--2,6-diaminopimelate ligase [Firmicutes bacterium ZCTH02-B6]